MYVCTQTHAQTIPISNFENTNSTGLEINKVNAVPKKYEHPLEIHIYEHLCQVDDLIKIWLHMFHDKVAFAKFIYATPLRNSCVPKQTLFPIVFFLLLVGPKRI